jgi:hypothetical protein
MLVTAVIHSSNDRDRHEHPCPSSDDGPTAIHARMPLPADIAREVPETWEETTPGGRFVPLLLRAWELR